MDTIRTYIENMFASYPQTQEVIRMKEELLGNMEDKYNELKNSGKSENEAVGIVISQFGNIEELMSELNVHAAPPVTEPLPVLTLQQANAFVAAKAKQDFMVAFGVFFCILAPATLVLSGGYIEKYFHDNDLLSSLCLIPLFLLIGIGVTLFIFADRYTAPFEFMKRPFQPGAGVKSTYEKILSDTISANTGWTAFGVLLCIFAPLTLIIINVFNRFEDEFISGFSIFLLLVIIAFAVFIFIFSGSKKEACAKILQTEEYSVEVKEHKPVVSTIINSILWPLVVCGYLIWSFTTHSWGISWIVFPVAGIISGMISSIEKIVTQK